MFVTMRAEPAPETAALHDLPDQPVQANEESEPVEPIDVEALVESLVEPNPAPTPDTRPLFTGQVTSVAGSASADVGATCEVHTDSVDNMLFLIAPDGLTVRCGAETLYRFDARALCSLRGQPEDFGGLFTFTCEDRGIRDDRPEMELRSADRHLRIWSETQGWSVTVALEDAAARVALRRRFDSPGRNGLPLAAPASLALRVQESVGDGGPSSATRLTLTAVPVPPPNNIHNCAFTLREGRRTVGQSRGTCVLDSELNLIGIDAGLTDRRRFSIMMERNEDVVTIQSADRERSWRVQTLIEGD